MATTFKRVCIEDYTIVADDGATFTLTRGTEYTTSPEHADGTVRVYSRYWVNVPARIFAGAVQFSGPRMASPIGNWC